MLLYSDLIGFAELNVMGIFLYLLISFWYGVSPKTTGKTIIYVST